MSVCSCDSLTVVAMSSPSNNNNNNNNEKPLTIGVFGGSFNPIHLGHALLCVTTQQTMPVDRVVLVPVYKHAVKRDLLPFDDRVNMCTLAVSPYNSGTGNITVSTIERDVGESNGAMLQALKQKYPPHAKFKWICGDDFFRWWQRPKGLETLEQVDGLIVQRRLHKSTNANDSFYKEPINEGQIRAVATKLDLSIDFIYGELPHFSSTLVRRAPGTWRSFLPQSVTQYLDARPHLLQQLHDNLEADAKKEASNNIVATSMTSTGKRPREEGGNEMDTTFTTNDAASSFAAMSVMKGLELVHALQIERGRIGLALSMGSDETYQQLNMAQANTDSLIQEFLDLVPSNMNNANDTSGTWDEVMALAEDLQQIPVWLTRDRAVVKRHGQELVQLDGSEGWARRLSLVEKFNARIDVLIGSSIRALHEILQQSSSSDEQSLRDVVNLLLKWSQGKEALGRLRAFVCAGGPDAPSIVRENLEMRELLSSMIDRKEKSVGRVLSLQASSQIRLAAPDALHKLLEQVTQWEWALMGCFASSTPLPLVHKLLSSSKEDGNSKESSGTNKFDVESFFEASSAALDLMLTFVKALAASGIARA